MDSLTFKPIRLEDRAAIQHFTLSGASQICDLSFANLYGWAERYGTCWTTICDTLIISFQPLGRPHPAFLMPICDSPKQFTSALDVLREHTQRAGYPLVLMGVGPLCREKLDTLAPGAFHYLSNEGSADYIYLRERLATLSGKSLQSKRNHINKFERLYPDYQYEEITASNLAECLDIATTWLEQTSDDESKQAEQQMIRRITMSMHEIGVVGGAIRVEGRIIAFALGSPINNNTYDIHVEKALTDYEGAFTIINREYAKRIPEQYTYINREEDLGIEGLRKSKLSYKPELILTKDVAIMRHEVSNQ